MIKVYFRTDFNDKIGLGHYNRSVSIAEILKKKYEVFFVFNKNTTTNLQLINTNQYPIIFVDHENDFYDLLKPENIVVVDSYEFNEYKQSEINKKKVKLVVIDDLNSMVYNCHAIINHGILYKKEDYNSNTRTRFYLGLDYLMVKKEFRKVSKLKRKKIISESFKSVFICFGGTNQIELINETIKILIKSKIGIFNILINESLVNEISSEKAQINTFSNLNPTNIIQLIRKSDFAILPASTILLEAFTVGIPIISGWFVENQKFSLSEFEKMGLIVNINQFNSKDYNLRLSDALFLLKSKKNIIKNQKIKIKLKDQNYLDIFNNLALDN